MHRLWIKFSAMSRNTNCVLRSHREALAQVSHDPTERSNPSANQPVRRLTIYYRIGEELGVDPKVILATSHGRRSIDTLQLYDPSKANWDCESISTHGQGQLLIRGIPNRCQLYRRSNPERIRLGRQRNPRRAGYPRRIGRERRKLGRRDIGHPRID